MHNLLPPPAGRLGSLLWHCHNTYACFQKPVRLRQFSTATAAKPHDEVTDVAILGGGITGLATAYYLSTKLPSCNITLFEGSSRLGGWLNSTEVDVGSGKVVFEQGPRTLVSNTLNGQVTYNLLMKLNLLSRLNTVPSTAIAARNRYIYYPNHLVRMPSGANTLSTTILDIAYTAITEPLLKGVVSGILKEPFKPRRAKEITDESVGSFLSRRFGSPLVDNILSALMHGIYAGDIYQLSARSIMPLLWHYEAVCGSVTKGIARRLRGYVGKSVEDIELIKHELPTAPRGTSVHIFRNGIKDLTDALLSELHKSKNFRVYKNTWVEKLDFQKEGPSAQVNLKSLQRTISGVIRRNDSFSHTVSTISGVNLDKIVEIPSLRLTPSVTVMVVNLYFASSELLPVSGFGYLIPRSISFTENPELALGVIFDSDIERSSIADAGETTPVLRGTKITVMLGGHWWNEWTSYPDEEQGARMAESVLKRHLGIEEKPVVVRVGLHKNCIPQYTVGHDERMEQASYTLKKYEGRLRVAGNSYTGVGVNDCVRAAQDIAAGLVNGSKDTGLDRFVDGTEWMWFMHKGGLISQILPNTRS